jgi:hypothetical protein
MTPSSFFLFALSAVLFLVVAALFIVVLLKVSLQKPDEIGSGQNNLISARLPVRDGTDLEPRMKAPVAAPVSLDKSQVVPKSFENITIEEEAFLRRLGWSPSTSQYIEPLTEDERLQWELEHLNLPKLLADRRQHRSTHFSFRRQTLPIPLP